MNRLIKLNFEIFKKTKIIYLMFFSVLIIFIASFGYNVYKDYEYTQLLDKAYANQMNELMNSKYYLRDLAVEDESYNLQISYLEDVTKYLQTLMNHNNNNNNWKAKVLAENKYLELLNHEYSFILQTSPILTENSADKIVVNNYLLAKEIPPYSSIYQMKTSNISMVFNSGVYISLIVIICLFMIPTFINEFDSGVYKIFYTSSVNRFSYYISKVFSLIIVFGISAIISILIIGLLSYVLYGFGNINYPFIINGVTFSAYKIIIIKVLLLLLMIPLTIFISSFICIKVRQANLYFAIILIMIFVLYNFKIINYILLNQINNSPLLFSLLILGSIIFYGISYIVIKRIDLN